MKHLFVLLSLSVSLPLASARAAAERGQNTVVLDANAVANLRLDFAPAEPRVFEETAFALGRIEARPGSTAAVSSRIAGRVVGLVVAPGDAVAADADLVRVESRQAGDPPPIIALRAPIAGTVTTLSAHLGDPVEPAASLLEITDLSEVDAVARVPESAVGRLRVGETRARIRLTAFAGETFEGKLVRLGAAADPSTGTLAAHFRLSNPDGRLRPGLRAEFALVLASRADVVAVPREAVQGEGSAPRVVFVKDFELPNAFIKTPVVLGAQNDRFVEIVSGLFPGDEVVVRGAYSLSFASGGALSLKEALDAAHGHEHAADGSEMKSGAAKSASPADGHAHAESDDHDHSKPTGGERLWQIVAGALAVLSIALGVSLLRRPIAARKET